MNKITINFENCYGINKLKQEFDFSKSSTFTIYSPNGVMKTSFAKTFFDRSNGGITSDLVFHKKTICEIKDEHGVELDGEQIFVIKPYNEDFQSDKVSTLIANKDLKEKYEAIHTKINDSKDKLLKEVQRLSGVKNGIEEKISEVFKKENLFEVVLSLEKEVSSQEDTTFSTIEYNSVFNTDTINFLNQADFKIEIKEYIEKYNELLSKSKYLKYGFDHRSASKIQESLTENGFWGAKHSVKLFNNVSEKRDEEIESGEAFEKNIQEELATVLGNPDLLKKWNGINKKISANKSLRTFHDYISDKKDILPKLQDPESFSKEIWLSYFVDQKSLFLIFLNEYKVAKNEIVKILEEVRAEQKSWVGVVDEFSRRFLPTFKIKIGNQEDVILKKEVVPVFEFIFEDSETGDIVKKEKSDTLKVLSLGELRALYLLNIIFEIEARKKEGKETIFIIDDIADSFDYKNKYAIIQYLEDISKNPLFAQIILTHNFDFFRTIQTQQRMGAWKTAFIASKDGVCISLNSIIGENITDPFAGWKREMATDKSKFIAMIPFVRNIVDYARGKKDDYEKLTSILHWKNGVTENILVKDLKDIFTTTINDINFPTTNLEQPTVSLIFEEAERCLTPIPGVNLENKIVLSIAIRLKAEQFMWPRITNQAEIKTRQTKELIKRYREDFEATTGEEENLRILDEVNLMTPENIHLNSFMYEPILDMPDDRLRKLYTDVKSLR